MAVLTREWVELTTIGGDSVDKELFHVTWDAVTAEKDGYDHFMQKEIFEQPRAIRDTLAGRLKDGIVDLYGELSLAEEDLKKMTGFMWSLAARLIMLVWWVKPSWKNGPTSRWK